MGLPKPVTAKQRTQAILAKKAAAQAAEAAEKAAKKAALKQQKIKARVDLGQQRKMECKPFAAIAAKQWPEIKEFVLALEPGQKLQGCSWGVGQNLIKFYIHCRTKEGYSRGYNFHYDVETKKLSFIPHVRDKIDYTVRRGGVWIDKD